jgi:predicted transposase/invertase (TIGR01784 family)
MFINPKTDFAFKKIFGSKQSKDILISFLDAILYQNTSTITDLEILDPYQAPRIKGIKESFLDVKATLQNGLTVIIEMQVLNVLGFDKRVLYNAAKAFSIQLNVGEDYAMLNPIIALTITDFEMFPNSPKVISSFALREKEEMTSYSDDIELVFVELPKFQKDLDELEDLSDKWIYFLKNASTLPSVPFTMQSDAALNHAFTIAEQSRLTKEELEILEKREMFLHDNRNAIRYAEQKGRQEEKRDMAIALLKEGVSIDIIAQASGLSIEILEKLQQKV